MSLNCGIVGLPNVGKSTLFAALTAKMVPMENYPFCTIEPNKGIVQVPDERLSKIAEILKPGETIPTVVEFVDIAGLVKGASKGEGLGNQFLAHIREVGVIIHVVRCFDDPDVSHISDTIDPESDIETVNIELALADLETVERRMEKNERVMKSDNKQIAREAQVLQPLLDQMRGHLSSGRPARAMAVSGDRFHLLDDLHLITMKRQVFLCNIDEQSIGTKNRYVEAVETIAQEEGAVVLTLCGNLEAEIAMLETPEERSAFLNESGLSESGLIRLIRTAYDILGLRTFFTENGKEARAWTFHLGDKAPSAAGTIHTDFENGFIKAEVYKCEDLFTLGSVQKLREAGKLRIEGRDYEVEDGDMILFKFNTNG